MKKIYNWGGWSRNYGDLAIQAGQMTMLRDASSEHYLEFVPISSDLSVTEAGREFSPMLHSAFIDIINEDADMLLVGGGGQIMRRNEEESVSGWQFNISLEDLDRLNVPLVVYSVGFNDFPYDETSFPSYASVHIQAVIEKSALFSVRNSGTLNALIDMGIDINNVEVIPDPGMFCPIVGMKLPDINSAGFLIGLNWAGDRISMRYKDNELSWIIPKICHALIQLIEEQGGGKVVYIPHLCAYDITVASSFKEYLGDYFYGLHEMVPGLYPETLAQVPLIAGVYKKMDVVLGVRGHSNIIPFGTHTPFVGFGDHCKNRFFAEQIGGLTVGTDCCYLFEILKKAVEDKDWQTNMIKQYNKLVVTAKDFNERVIEVLTS